MVDGKEIEVIDMELLVKVQKGLVALKQDYLTEEFDADVAVAADELMAELTEQTRGRVEDQSYHMICAASHALAAALDEQGTPEMVSVAMTAISEVINLNN